MKNYSILLEVAGPLAMFARPDTGAAPTSYPAPTWSAAKGILESIAFLSGGEAWLHPLRVEICRPRGARGGTVSFQRYAFNCPLRKEKNVREGTGMQVFATVLANVCYRIHADVRGERGSGGRANRHGTDDDAALRARLEAREHVSARDLLAGSVQLWSNKIFALGLEPISGRPDVYWRPHPYDGEFLGYMEGALRIGEIARGEAPTD